MRQAELRTDDRDGVAYRGRSGRRPYLSGLPLLAILAAIVAAGMSGPRVDTGRGHPSEPRANVASSPAPVASPLELVEANAAP
jgi:hypothetical protein